MCDPWLGQQWLVKSEEWWWHTLSPVYFALYDFIIRRVKIGGQQQHVSRHECPVSPVYMCRTTPIGGAASYTPPTLLRMRGMPHTLRTCVTRARHAIAMPAQI